MALLLCCCIVGSLTIGCQDELASSEIVYSNDFDSGNLENIEGGLFTMFNGSLVIGNYNNDGFSIFLNELPEHNYISVSFDLYIHDTWDGNSNGLNPDAPDSWVMEVNSGITPSSTSSFNGFRTTFSNGPCDGILCLIQSYPSTFPFTRRPRTGARNANLPGLCALSGDPDGTSLYNIQRTFHHKDRALVLRFFDELFQSNVPDQKCDESWSMDNINIRTLKIN